VAAAKIEAAFADNCFSAAFGGFREGLNLSRGFPSLEERIVKLAVTEASKRLPRDWRIAKSLLLEAGEVDPGGEVPQALWEEVQQCERKETIDRALTAAEAALSTGTNRLARLRLDGLAARYPGDPRLETRLKGRAAAAQKPLESRPPAARSPEKPNRSVIQAIRARAREFEKSGLYDEAVEQLEELSKIDPLYPGLNEEIERCRRLKEKDQAVVAPSLALVPFTRAAAKPQPRLKSAANWNRLAALGCSAVLLSVTADLMWMQYSKSAAKPKTLRNPPPVVHPPVSPQTTLPPPPAIVEVIPSPPPDAISGATVAEAPKRKSFDSSHLTAPLAKLPPAGANELAETPPLVAPPIQDNGVSATPPSLPEMEKGSQAEADAWAAVNRNDLHSVESYLNRFPGGANHEIAEQVLTNLRRIEAEHQESAEVLNVLQQYAAAWTARNIESILSLERYLDRRTVKAELAPLKSLVMNLSPVSEPHIEGTQATVRCRRQVLQTFQDNVQKQSPEALVTFVLAKHDGAWIIQSVTP
jgi:tetratricopeptide (TPR) repeat protein